MEQQLCLVSTDGNSASSAMPVMGVYIATSTLVCLLLLIIDVVRGFRHRKYFLPSKFFSLNSLTLTLLGISTKLPLDLTSSMPSGVDQLSKLCGPVLITISMGFFMPCLGDMDAFELLGNLAALTILVVTVIVSITIQMSTGVILPFYYWEHAVALILMLLTLVVMWYVTFVKSWLTDSLKDSWKETVEDYVHKEPITTDNLKTICAKALMSSPQLTLGLFTNYVVYVSLLCLFSLGTLVVACVRTFFLEQVEFGRGNSDYKWSMWILVVAQILTVILATSAIAFRSFYITRLRLSSEFSTVHSGIGAEHLYQIGHLIELTSVDAFEELAKMVSIRGIHYLPLNTSRKSLVKLVKVLEEVVVYFLFKLHMVMSWTDNAVKALVPYIAKVISYTRSDSFAASILIGDEIKGNIGSYVQKCREGKPPHGLIQLLQKTQPSKVSSFSEENDCCLLAVLLVSIASIMVPLGPSLVDALDEVFEILYFIDQQTASSAWQQIHKKFAKDIWIGRGMSDHWFEKKVISPLRNEYPEIDKISGFEASYFLFKFTYEATINQVIRHGTGIEHLTKIVCLSMEKNISEEIISDQMELLFIDIMYFLLPQFPKIISEYISQSSVAESESRTRKALELVSKFESLTPHVKWLALGNNTTANIDEGFRGDGATSSTINL